MAQINLYQYAEVIGSNGKTDYIGSRIASSTITLTGTGEVYHRVFNDVPAVTLTTLYNDELTGIKFFGVKSTKDATLGFSAANMSSSNCNAVKLVADVWQFFTAGKTTDSASTLGTRTAEALIDIEIVKIYVAGAVAADVEVILAY